MQLQSCDGTLIATQTTSAGGFYSFTNLDPGSYQIKVVPPAGMALSPAFSGSARSKDSNVTPETLTTGCLTMSSGQTRAWVDVGIIY